MHTQDLVDRMKEAIPHRRYVETTTAFCELMQQGYPLRSAVQDVMEAGGPYTHLPLHMSVQKGRPFKVSNDHCVLDTNTALHLMQYMPPGTALLPVVQSMWYWPQGIDVWGQTQLDGWSGDTTDTILAMMNYLKAKGTPRYPTQEDWSAYPPAQRHYTSEVVPITAGSVEERLEAFRSAVMMCDQDDAYGLFLGLAPVPGIRQRLQSELLYTALTDVQERIRQGHLRTLQHTTIRARALIDLANYLGWEQAQSVFYATIPDIAMGPRFYSMHDLVATLCEEAFGDSLPTLKASNTMPLTDEEITPLLTTICGTDAWAVCDQITQLLRGGRAVQSIADAIVLAAARVVTLAELNGVNPGVWVHSVDYCNVVNAWLRHYDHPYQPQGLYFMALVTHHAIPAYPKPAYTDSVDLVIDGSSLPTDLTPDDLLERLQDSLDTLDVHSSLQSAQAYLQSGGEARALLGTLALAAAKTQDNPHHHQLVNTALEEYTHSTLRQKDEFLLMAAAYLGGARSVRDCYELYRRYFPPEKAGR
jgi:hypothetical protein